MKRLFSFVELNSNFSKDQKSIRYLNKHINNDFKCIVKWLIANKVSSWKNKSEMIVLKFEKSETNGIVKRKRDGKILYSTDKVRYFRIKLN